ncbi:unnamed protein product [Didymodactylos carnosus]|uniref:Peptidase C1A papain C-terminal domain-containing protein n=1 Tax=Didymodactylos carnosus TaxID=1234261 RepID=A0A814C400_9BILA|nr:unnamed protein product [Didymodactylos carnosus]CAF0938893.1 unnamed protein product [Didymodactylos carnosus]CAF3637130.1 unnamed protein product [Didymodactylos carnosus]CAF3715690.1 unnamed protein product [Didymodactylos carnosus]
MREERSQGHQTFTSDPNVELPDAVDWRDKGDVVRVKDQGQCGACWAFSAVGSIESAYAIKTGKLVSLSEQQLIDCSGEQGNMGCNGGLMDQAFEYVIAAGGIESEDAYPYEAAGNICVFNTSEVIVKVCGFIDIASEDETALQQAVATIGPMSVAIDASHSSFQLYKRGIYNEPACSQTQLDHGVLAIGYGKESGKDYWLVQNSWGSDWGDHGYIKMTRNKKNQCDAQYYWFQYIGYDIGQSAMIKTNQQLIDLLPNFAHQQQTSTSVIEKLVTIIDKLHMKFDQQLAFEVTNQSLAPIFSSQPVQQSQTPSILPLNTSSSQSQRTTSIVPTPTKQLSSTKKQSTITTTANSNNKPIKRQVQHLRITYSLCSDLHSAINNGQYHHLLKSLDSVTFVVGTNNLDEEPPLHAFSKAKDLLSVTNQYHSKKKISIAKVPFRTKQTYRTTNIMKGVKEYNEGLGTLIFDYDNVDILDMDLKPDTLIDEIHMNAKGSVYIIQILSPK